MIYKENVLNERDECAGCGTKMVGTVFCLTDVDAPFCYDCAVAEQAKRVKQYALLSEYARIGSEVGSVGYVRRMTA